MIVTEPFKIDALKIVPQKKHASKSADLGPPPCQAAARLDDLITSVDNSFVVQGLC
jgi:hypothetical protein